ncbi:hypothetical protein ElyMa_000262000 [Elysia marginata]|uniref:Uncharacterized protein n=1 Tax=Elysia marginata TaxID=1093978 RepID=A0AAV4F562_9GAST|nr:hypothetical protein ElyMa_000262000 [Elysia marginata]
MPESVKKNTAEVSLWRQKGREGEEGGYTEENCDSISASNRVKALWCKKVSQATSPPAPVAAALTRVSRKINCLWRSISFVISSHTSCFRPRNLPERFPVQAIPGSKSNLAA